MELLLPFTIASVQGAAPSDRDLVLAARAGDRDAFGRLFRRYAPMIHGILLARSLPADADDLLQDVFVAAMRRIDGLRDVEAVGGWLATIARNRLVDHLRARRPTAELSEDIPTHDADRAEAERVLVVIQSLPAAYHETLVLRLVEGMTGPEIAAQLGLTHESVRVNLHRGMKLLREKLGVAAATGRTTEET